jgi:arabinose-5-phosphate isomerase
MPDPLAAARTLLKAEILAIERVAQRLDSNLERAVQLILDSAGKVLVTGVGKSGLIGRKLSATLRATGTPSVFLHPIEALHGDLGIYTPGDPTILISKSGASDELVRLLPALRSLRSPLIGILGNTTGPLAKEVDVLLDASVEAEGDPHNLVPAASAIAAQALGDALAVALMDAREFSPEKFGNFHPAGQLGRNLLRRVADAMHAGDEVPWVSPADSLRDVVIAMTQKPLGAACVLDDAGCLAGLITDGDLRRMLERHEDIRGLCARDVMTDHPLSVGPDATLREALVLMEKRPRQLSVLPVVQSDGRALGLLRLHDIYQAGL